jgi:hypothetical protein
MKNVFNQIWLKVLLLSSLMINAMVTIAQEGGGEGGSVSVTKTTTTTNSENWYTNPWVLIVGGAVFILLLVAIARGRK